MNKYMHREITDHALCRVGLHDNAKTYVREANVDSDHSVMAANMDNQHYCGGPPRDVIEKCQRLINKSLWIAALLARRNNETEMMDALYFLGRAFHCAQDFYAHSNWVALGNLNVWHHKPSPPALKFCDKTPLDQKLRNDAWFGRTFRIRGLKIRGRRATYKKIIASYEQCPSVLHPDMNLDMPGTFEEEAIKRGSKTNFGGIGPYQRAHLNAALDTKNYWDHFKYRLFPWEIFDPASTAGKQNWETFLGKLQDKQRYQQNYRRYTHWHMAWQNFTLFDPREIARSGKKIKGSRAVFQDYFGARPGFFNKLGAIPQEGWAKLVKRRWDGGIF